MEGIRAPLEESREFTSPGDISHVFSQVGMIKIVSCFTVGCLTFFKFSRVTHENTGKGFENKPN